VSQENSEFRARAEAVSAAVNRRDWDAVFAELDPEVEWTPVEEGVCYRGREAFLEYTLRFLEAWEEFRMELEHIEVAPTGDRTLASLRYRGRIVATEMPIDGRYFQVIDWRNGKQWRGKEYTDEADARQVFERAEE
jgi:ketosteroid isomerase-like protein